MQSAWTISRAALLRKARARRKGEGEERGDERRKGRRGSKTSSTSNRAPLFFPPLFLSTLEEEKRERERVLFFSLVHTAEITLRERSRA